MRTIRHHVNTAHCSGRKLAEQAGSCRKDLTKLDAELTQCLDAKQADADHKRESQAFTEDMIQELRKCEKDRTDLEETVSLKTAALGDAERNAKLHEEDLEGCELANTQSGKLLRECKADLGAKETMVMMSLQFSRLDLFPYRLPTACTASKSWSSSWPRVTRSLIKWLKCGKNCTRSRSN